VCDDPATMHAFEYARLDQQLSLAIGRSLCA
jgi:hypothetical protein